jgi:hypothetical protein
VRRVSNEDRAASDPPLPPCLPLAPFLVLMFFINLQVVTMVLVHAFLNLRHNETESSAVLTLLNSTSLCTGALLRLTSKMVLRQSSTASLIPVTTMMTIKGAALRAGLEAPNMLKIYAMCC